MKFKTITTLGTCIHVYAQTKTSAIEKAYLTPDWYPSRAFNYLFALPA